MPAWNDYQEEVAAFFRTLGLEAATNVTIEGVRTRHEVDVVVRSRQVGLDVSWLVECKSWRARVPKEKVFALRAIVDDVGADRGLMMAERGYQSGALEAARRTNIVLTSLADLQETARFDLGEVRLNGLLRRVDACRHATGTSARGTGLISGFDPIRWPSATRETRSSPRSRGRCSTR